MECEKSSCSIHGPPLSPSFPFILAAPLLHLRGKCIQLWREKCPPVVVPLQMATSLRVSHMGPGPSLATVPCQAVGVEAGPSAQMALVDLDSQRVQHATSTSQLVQGVASL